MLSETARLEFDLGVMAAGEEFEAWLEQCAAEKIDPRPFIKEALDATG